MRLVATGYATIVRDKYIKFGGRWYQVSDPALARRADELVGQLACLTWQEGEDGKLEALAVRTFEGEAKTWPPPLTAEDIPWDWVPRH